MIKEESFREESSELREIIRKIKSGEKLNPGEVQIAIIEFAFEDEDTQRFRGDERRWNETVYVVFNLDGEWYELNYERALTEMQESDFFAQVAEKIQVSQGYVKCVSYGAHKKFVGNAIPAEEIRKRALWNKL